jgi:hypothetical protein
VPNALSNKRIGEATLTAADFFVRLNARGGETLYAVPKRRYVLDVYLPLKFLPLRRIQAVGCDDATRVKAGLIVELLGAPEGIVTVEHNTVSKPRNVLWLIHHKSILQT